MPGLSPIRRPGHFSPSWLASLRFTSVDNRPGRLIRTQRLVLARLENFTQVIAAAAGAAYGLAHLLHTGEGFVTGAIQRTLVLAGIADRGGVVRAGGNQCGDAQQRS